MAQICVYDRYDNDNKRLTGDEASSQGVKVLEELRDTDPLCCTTQSVLHITPHRVREGHRWGSLWKKKVGRRQTKSNCKSS